MSDALEPDRLPETQLKEWRKDTRSRAVELNVSISALARESGVPEPTLRSWMTRLPGPTLWGRQCIAAALDRLEKQDPEIEDGTTDAEAWRATVSAALRDHEITVRRLADKARVSESALRKWMKGPAVPRPENRDKVDTALRELAIPGIDQPSSATE